MNARARYVLTHWGKFGPVPHRDLYAPDLRAGPLVELGELVSVVYLTQKGGDREPTEYEHAFCPKNLPVLAFNRGGLFIVGGGYRVGVRGIHG